MNQIIDLKTLALEFTQTTSDPLEAFTQWENEREALADIYEDNQRLEAEVKHLRAALSIAEKLVNSLAVKGTLFMDPKMRELMEKFREQMNEAE